MSKTLRRQSGLTLVELMVATTLSLVLLSGVLLVFQANRTTYQMQTGLGTLQENGRYAIGQITADLRNAGFGGCLSPSLEPTVRVLAASAPAFITDLAAGEFFDGNDNVTAGSFDSINIFDGPDHDGDGNPDGTDWLEIRGPLRSDIRYVTGEIVATGDVEIMGTGSGVAVDEYVFIADCAGADIFRATAVATSSGNTRISHDTSLNTQSTLSRRFGADSVVSEVMTHTYFVGETSRTNAAGQAVNALYRFDGTNAQELVDGVEDLQIEFALDTDADNVVDTFRDPGGVTNWNEVKAVRISLLLNSVEAANTEEANYRFFPAGNNAIAPPTGDRLLRQEFSTLVSVRNAVL
jgi:type IV pilus assembly protein PilW